MQVSGAHARKSAPEPVELDDYYHDVHLDTQLVKHAGMDTRSQVRRTLLTPTASTGRALASRAFGAGAARGGWGSRLRTEEAL